MKARAVGMSSFTGFSSRAVDPPPAEDAPLTDRERRGARRAMRPLIAFENNRARAARIYITAIRFPIYTAQGCLRHSFWNSQTEKAK